MELEGKPADNTAGEIIAVEHTDDPSLRSRLGGKHESGFSGSFSSGETVSASRAPPGAGTECPWQASEEHGTQGLTFAGHLLPLHGHGHT